MWMQAFSPPRKSSEDWRHEIIGPKGFAEFQGGFWLGALMKIPSVQRAVIRTHPSLFMGFRFQDWARLLREHSIDAAYWPRCSIVTATSALTSFLSTFEDSIERELPHGDEWRHPVFIIGLPRSGTTLLYHLLAKDTQFAVPTRLEAFNPHTFLTLRKLGIGKLLSHFPLHSRVIDRVRVGWMAPEDDDVAVFVLTGIPGQIWRAFPREPDRGCECFKENSPEARRWIAALQMFTRKLSMSQGKPALMKSPHNAQKIPELLQAFPEAKFVTIFRKPETHFPSFRAMFAGPGTGWDELQRRPPSTDEELLTVVQRQLKRYFATKMAIPPGNLVEVTYEELVSDRVSTLSRIYAQLGLPGFDSLAQALPHASGYEKNIHEPLSPDAKALLRYFYAPVYGQGIY